MRGGEVSQSSPSTLALRQAPMGRAADQEEHGRGRVAGDHPRHVCLRGKTRKVPRIKSPIEMRQLTMGSWPTTQAMSMRWQELPLLGLSGGQPPGVPA